MRDRKLHRGMGEKTWKENSERRKGEEEKTAEESHRKNKIATVASPCRRKLGGPIPPAPFVLTAGNFDNDIDITRS